MTSIEMAPQRGAVATGVSDGADGAGAAEAQVAEVRTKELERLAELERFQRLTVGRELKMIELKKEIEELKRAALVPR